jgi:hypothetical protein
MVDDAGGGRFGLGVSDQQQRLHVDLDSGIAPSNGLLATRRKHRGMIVSSRPATELTTPRRDSLIVRSRRPEIREGERSVVDCREPDCRGFA